MQTGAIVGIQDMGAAGLTCSTCEMGARGGVGLDVELDLVPQRETGMTAYEIMLSESQERMLLVAEKGREDEVLRVFAKWGLDAVIVGTVQPEPRLRIRHHGELVADIPNQSLTDDAPLYHRPVGTWKAPVPLDPPEEVLAELAKDRDFTADLKKLLASANVCSKRWVHEQYDTMVQTNTVIGPGGEAGVMRIKGTGTAGPRARPGHGARRQRPLGLSRSQTRRHARRGRGRAQGRLHRRNARGRHQLPQLRQSRKAGDHGAALRRHRRHRRSLHRARNAHHRRQCLPLQRDPRRRHLSHPGARHRRHSRRRHQGRPRAFPARRTTPSCCSGPFRAAKSQTRNSKFRSTRRPSAKYPLPALERQPDARAESRMQPRRKPRPISPPSALRSMPRSSSAASGARRPRSISKPKPTCTSCWPCSPGAS